MKILDLKIIIFRVEANERMQQNNFFFYCEN